MRRFRFFAMMGMNADDGRQLARAARTAEAIGYHGLVAADHLSDQYAPVTVLGAVAAATDRLRLGTFVLNAGLRHPAVLAQDLATLDRLSDGRVEVGLGAGWNRAEHDAIGLPFDPPAGRVSRLTEVIDVLRRCFSGETFSFAGTHYSIEDFRSYPPTVQRPHPPFLVGGGGRRLLTLAGRQADVVGLAPRLLPGRGGEPLPDPRSLTAAATAQKIEWVRDAAGDRFDRLELNTYPTMVGSGMDPLAGPTVVTPHARFEAERRADRLAALTGIAITAEEVLESPLIFIGSVDELIEKVLALRERFGISSIMVGDMMTMAPVVERLSGR